MVKRLQPVWECLFVAETESLSQHNISLVGLVDFEI